MKNGRENGKNMRYEPQDKGEIQRGTKTKVGLSVFFSLFVFTNFAITALIVAGISFAAIRTGLIGNTRILSHFVLIVIVLISSVIVGTIVSLIIGKIPLRPIRKVIASTNQLANGDFSARLDISHPPEFHELADSFNRMAEELGGIELLRKDFVNNFSHEFKTPIVSIKGFAEMLKYNDLTPEERDEYLDIVINESGRLAALATNVLNLSKVENQSILSEKHLFNLGEQVRRSILLLEPKWEQKKLSFSADILDVRCVGNEELLSQVWLNLIDNAVKFTTEGGKISVTLRPEKDRVKFVIRDSAAGISPDSMARIFDKFYQADESHATEGNGLGLTLAEKIIKLHGGDIECKSKRGEGTEFTVTLPLK